MIAFICLFFPAVGSVWLFEALTKNDLKFKKVLFRFCTNALVINFICFAAKMLVLNSGNETVYNAGMDMMPETAFKYLVMAIPVAVVLVLLEVLLSKKVKITVEEEADETQENR